jgi:cytochrome c oxidase cbb3-type subunit 3
MCSRCLRIAAAGVCLIVMGACQREKRELRPNPANAAVFGNAAAESLIQPGATQQPVTAVASEGNSYSISEGQRLFDWYNCSGCHFGGGGGIGPPLIKQVWTYGDAPENLFDTIVKGRPNGMPAWGKRIPEYQVWQLVAFVRSLNRKEPKAATPVRTDSIQADPSSLRPPKGATQ